VEDLEDDGILAQPCRNALALLGWSYDDKTTTFTTGELIERFSITRVSKSPAVFDMKKLEVMNGRFIRTLPPEDFEDALVAFHAKSGYLAGLGEGAEDTMRHSAALVQRKLTKLSEYDLLAGWLFRPLDIEPEAWEVIAADVKHSIQAIGGGLGRIDTVEPWTLDAVKDALQDQLHILGENAREFLEPIRISVTGRRVSTGIYESIWFLGRDEATGRMRATLGRLAELWGDAA